MIWFTADTHFGHHGILLHQRRRLIEFESLEEMDAQLIAQINQVVERDDVLYHLGDFCWRASRAGHYRQRLRVKQLHVIRGNHDATSLREHCSTLRDMAYLSHNRVRVHLCHYPLLSWNGLHNGSVHLYGHSHGRYEDELDKLHPDRRSMDIGIDNIHRLTGEWRPISLDEVLGRLPVKTEERAPGPWEGT